VGGRLDLSPAAERSVRDEAPIPLDLDGDGRAEVLRPRILTFRRWQIPGVERAPDGWLEYYLLFDIEGPGRRRLDSIFKFRVGTENGGYERYSLQASGDLDGDGRGDLAFRVGGELPEELVLLLDRGEEFVARSTGPLRCRCRLSPDLGVLGEDGARLASWEPVRKRFHGSGMAWTLGGRATLRVAPGAGSPALVTLPGGAAIRLLGGETVGPPGWLRAEADGSEGWISARLVEEESPEGGP
jgi:hypothetical protein